MSEWNQYYDDEPWGELRADMRAAANTLWNRGAGVSDVPDLVHPYFDATNPEELGKRAQLLDAKIAEMNNGSK